MLFSQLNNQQRSPASICANPKTRRRVRFAVALASLLGGAGTCLAEGSTSDYRANFPTQYSESAMGVNLQTGKFRYQLYSFDTGPFQVRRGFGQPDFNYEATLRWSTLGSMTVIKVKFTESKTELVFLSDYQPWTAQTMGWNLVRSGAGYLLTDKSGNVYRLDDSGSASGGGIPAAVKGITYADGSRLDITSSAGKTFYRSSRGYGMLIEDATTARKVCGFNLAQTYADAASNCDASSYKVILNKVDLGGGNFHYSSVTDVLGNVSAITNANNGLGPVQCVTIPNTSTCEFTNTYGNLPTDPVPLTRGDQVRIQVDAAGRQWTYSYDPPDNPLDSQPAPGFPVWSSSFMTDPAGRNYGLEFDRGVLVRETTPEGNRVYSYPSKVYNLGNGTLDYHGTRPNYLKHPEGNLDYLISGRRGQVLLVIKAPKGAPEPSSAVNNSAIFSSDPDLHDCCVSPDVPNTPAGGISYGQGYLPDYPAGQVLVSGCGTGLPDAKLCDKPLLRIDPKGAQTDFTYDAAHGGVLTETGPADVNGVRPVKRYAYQQRHAWVKDAGGSYVHSGSPIWLLATERRCNTSATVGGACAAGTSDEVLTTYDYGPDSGPNNLSLRGVIVTAGGQSLRSCYSYDANGRKVSETKPSANLTVCSL